MLRLTLIGMLALASAATAPAADYALIAHPSVGVRSLPREAASRLFLKKNLRWSDGTTARPVDLPLDSSVRGVFSEDVHGRGVGAVDAYWQRQIFGGRKTPPVVKSSEAEVVAWVSANPGAIGYVSTTAVVGAVRVIQVSE